MRYISERGLWLIFGATIATLAILGLITAGVTSRYAQTQDWVSHSHDVETTVDQVRASLFAAEAARLQFFATGDQDHLSQYRQAIEELKTRLPKLDALTHSDSDQQLRVVALSNVVSRQLALMDESITLTHSDSVSRLLEINHAAADRTAEAARVLRAMREHEAGLMQARVVTSSRALRRIIYLLVTTGVVILLILAAALKLLLRELSQRRHTDAAIRRLSGRILFLQDAERRRVARDLHDSLGQSLAAVAMNLSVLKDNPSLSPERCSGLLEDSLNLVRQVVSETRTISHLLHPPLLDEAGLSSAAKWYLDGFTERSGIPVKLEIGSDVGRLPRDTELVLFRALQEGLTNIHKHAGPCQVTVRLERTHAGAAFTIHDNGRGIPEHVLRRLDESGGGTGVGLAGMRERVTELGGRFFVRSTRRGTTIRVLLPPELAKYQQETPTVASERSGQQPMTLAS